LHNAKQRIKKSACLQVLRYANGIHTSNKNCYWQYSSFALQQLLTKGRCIMTLQEITNWHLEQVAELRRDGDENQRNFHLEIVAELVRIERELEKN
jgi:hypothetical protein